MNLRRLVFSRSLLVTVLALSSVSCGPKPEEEKLLIRPVRVVHIEKADTQSKQSLAGVARASQEMTLSFRVSGTITELPVKLGQEVKKGDLIASMDTKDVRLEIERAKASVARANAEYRSAQADFERSRSLYADGSGSQAELDAARALAESTKALLSAENENLKLSRSKLDDHRLVAPLPGAIAEVNVEVNENAQSGQAIALLNAGEKAEVEVAVPERLIQLFQKGLPAKINFDAITDKVFDGVVTEVGVASSSNASGFPVRVALLEADPRVRAGLAALVNLDLRKSGQKLRIHVPPPAVLEDNKGVRFVYVAEPAEEGFATVKRRDVVLGEPTTSGLHIKEGLEGGELLIIAGLGQIAPGLKVRLLPDDQPALAKNRVVETRYQTAGATPLKTGGEKTEPVPKPATPPPAAKDSEAN